jgi:hypothetical protein
MLQGIRDKISACLERAEQCREAAASETDGRVRQQLLNLEQQWQDVARSYSLSRLLSDFFSPVTLCRQRSVSCRRTSPQNRRPHFAGTKFMI